MHIGRCWLYSQFFKSIRDEDQWTSFLWWALPRVELPLGRGKLRVLSISRAALAAELVAALFLLGRECAGTRSFKAGVFGMAWRNLLVQASPVNLISPTAARCSARLVAEGI